MNVLQMGCRGTAVEILQRALNIMPDGIFGNLTLEAVKEFQKAHHLKADGIVGGNTWAKLGVSKDGFFKKSTRNITELIVHCSATPEGKDFSVAQLRDMHRARKFTDVGYHYIIYRDGSINPGRDVNIAGAHCVNHNTNSIGVCYIGGCDATGKTPKDTRTPAQKKALVELLKKLKLMYPTAKIHSHKDFANKACPSFDATKEYADIK